MRDLKESGPRATAAPCGCVKPALETGNLLTEPIGYLESCFSAKNGTPRQPSICSHSRACLRIRKSIFNNPEHSLMGLEQFSHVWILFVFHKNGHLSCKAKVQPPRLNGAKTGVFSTRSPHRPNAIGLTLAKLERVEGGAVYLSGIDMIHGTPVLDIKPYIADYDSPQNVIESSGDFTLQNNQDKLKTGSQSEGNTDGCDWQQLPGHEESEPCCRSEEKPKCPGARTSGGSKAGSGDAAHSQQSSAEPRERAAELGEESGPRVAQEQSGPQSQEESPSEEHEDSRLKRGAGAAVPEGRGPEMPPKAPPRAAGAAQRAVVPAWVSEAPWPAWKSGSLLTQRWTLSTSAQVNQVLARLHLRIFSQRRKRGMPSRLCWQPILGLYIDGSSARIVFFYFTVDTAHVTCWFGDGFAEVLRIKPASEPVQMSKAAESPGSLGS